MPILTSPLRAEAVLARSGSPGSEKPVAGLLQEAGFRQGFEEGYAAAHKGPNGAAVTVAEGKNSAETWAAADAHFVIRSGVNNS